jgi:hypothetical protein
MRRKTIAIATIALTALFVALAVSNATTWAQTGGGYELTWNSIDGGGGASSGGGFTLTGAIGQPDAGLQMSGGGYTLDGGFWPGAAPNYRVFLPLVVKG